VDLYTWHRTGAYPALLAAASAPEAAVPTFDPRLSARWLVTSPVVVTASVGLYHQGPSFLVPLPGVQPAGLTRGVQTALQRSAGIEAALPWSLTTTATAFWHEYGNVNDFSACNFDSGEVDVSSGCIQARESGRAFGAELLVRRSFGERLSGWV